MMGRRARIPTPRTIPRATYQLSRLRRSAIPLASLREKERARRSVGWSAIKSHLRAASTRAKRSPVNIDSGHSGNDDAAQISLIVRAVSQGRRVETRALDIPRIVGASDDLLLCAREENTINERRWTARA